MIRRLRTARILSLILATGLILAACERPLTSNTDQEELPTPVVVTIEGDAASPDDAEEVNDEEIAPEEEGAEEETPVEEAADQEENPEEVTDTSHEDVGEVTAEEQEDDAAEGSADASEEEADESPAEETAADEDEAPMEEDGAGDDTASDETEDGEEDVEASSVDAEETADSEPIEDETAEESEEDVQETPDETAGEDTDSQELDVTDSITHTVVLGENLYRISVIYGVPMAEIAQFNDIVNTDNIFAGQILLIPAAGTTDSEGDAASDSDAEDNDEPIEPPSEFTDYTVLPGDTLASIGLKFGVSWVEIAEANGIDNPNQISAGQVLKIPVSTPGPSPEFTHVVRPGDSLRRISFIYGIPWLSIATANNILSPYFIHPGQKLLIPASGWNTV